jgi:hypothetical protein
MSFYFSQLLAASGVRVSEKPTPAPLQPAALLESPEIVEITGEEPVESFATAFPPPTVGSQPVAHVIAEPSPMRETTSIPVSLPKPDPSAPGRVSVETAHIEGLSPPAAQFETLSALTAQQPPSHPPATLAPSPGHGASQGPGPLPQPPEEGDHPPPQATAEEIFGAVMNWIAAGKTQPRDAGAVSPLPPSASVQQDPPVSPPPELQPVVEQSVPERSIVEVQAVATSASVPAAETGPALAASGPGAALMSGNALPSITIGTIHLRVEAPPVPSPAPHPAIPAGTKAPPSPSASRLKLRRHYVLPH